jgi:hypothetical protein
MPQLLAHVEQIKLQHSCRAQISTIIAAGSSAQPQFRPFIDTPTWAQVQSLERPGSQYDLKRLVA